MNEQFVDTPELLWHCAVTVSQTFRTRNAVALELSQEFGNEVQSAIWLPFTRILVQEYPVAQAVQVYCPEVIRYAQFSAMVMWLVVGLLASRVLETTCETLKLTCEVLEIVPAIDNHFAVPAEVSKPARRSFKLSTFPTRRFHCEDCN